MANMDEKERERIEQILNKIEKEYPRNMETESIIQDTFKKINLADKALIKSSFQVCKSETEELTKYASFNDKMGLEMKDNIDERKFEESLKKWQGCLQSKYKDFTEVLLTMDKEFNLNNNAINNCIEDCASDSSKKNNEVIENCIRNCMQKHENSYNTIIKKYNNIFKDYEKKFEQYL